ncbi:MAG: heme exporter protein CcmD [Rhodospirillaceae bacterium]
MLDRLHNFANILGEAAPAPLALPVWNPMSEYFAMGGYAAYVWPAYAVTLVMLVATLVASLASLRRREAMVKALEAARPPRAARRNRDADAPAVPDTPAAPALRDAQRDGDMP